MEYTIVREDNKYKKILKWHLIGTSEGGTYSRWFETQEEAIKHQLFCEWQSQQFNNRQPNF